MNAQYTSVLAFRPHRNAAAATGIEPVTLCSAEQRHKAVSDGAIFVASEVPF